MKILFCSDGTVQAEKAVRFGAPIAASCQAEVSLLGIAKKADGEKKLLKALRATQDIFKKHGLDAEVISKVGKPVREIVKHTRETHYDLVVIGAVRKNPYGRLLDPLWRTVLSHSVRAYRIIKSVEPPVLMVIGHRAGLHRILMCTDGAAHLDKAVQFIGKIAQAVHADVDLFHVMPQPPEVYAEVIRIDEAIERLLDSTSELGLTLRHQKDMLEKFGVFGEMRLHSGLVVPELLKESHQSEYDLVVCGFPPVGERLRKFMMGDVTRDIINSADLPILVVRTKEPGRLARFFRRFPAGLFGGSQKNSAAKKGGEKIE